MFRLVDVPILARLSFDCPLTLRRGDLLRDGVAESGDVVDAGFSGGMCDVVILCLQ